MDGNVASQALHGKADEGWETLLANAESIVWDATWSKWLVRIETDDEALRLFARQFRKP